jgi:hypothetical protein
MHVELASYTPYILFIFGIVITYIGWTTKKILENIENAIKSTAKKVDYHDRHITEILAILKVHDFKIQSINDDIVMLKKSDTM